MSRLRMVLPAVCLLVAVAGCGSARMLSYNSDTGVGVVAIPSNANYWPLKYRDEATRLMAEKCPNGYDIVEEKEVVIGKRATTNHTMDRQEPIQTRRGPLERTSSSSVTTVSDQTEYQITFRARAVPAPAPAMIAPRPSAPPAAPPGLPPRPVPFQP